MAAIIQGHASVTFHMNHKAGSEQRPIGTYFASKVLVIRRVFSVGDANAAHFR
jgi:hypothetical protein